MFRHLLRLGLLTALCLAASFPFINSSRAQESYRALEQWQQVALGEVVYAEVLEAPDAVYRNPYLSDDPADWIREPNTFLFGEAINVSERHRFLDRDHMVRVRIYSSEWGELLPDGLHSPYLPDPTQFHPTYIHLSYLYPLSAAEFVPITLYDDTQNMDKLIVVVADTHPHLMLYEGERLIMKIPVVLGPTPYGDYRVYRTRVTDDMPGIPGVPFSNYFSGGYTIHGAPWWNWRETVRGHYGSHGCINLPDDEWYQVQWGSETLSVDQWVYRWISSNIDYDENDPALEQSRVGSENPGWYQPFASVRTLVVHQIEDLHNLPLTRTLGPLVREAQVSQWQPLVEAYHSLEDSWRLPHLEADGLGYEHHDATRSIAQIVGDSESDTWVLLACNEREYADDPAYPGSSRTVHQVCEHLRVERQGSICTPERVDIAFFGQKTMCDADKFNALHIRERGELIEHERIHHQQFGRYFRTLALQGVAADDPSPFEVTVQQNSFIGVTELMAQSQNISSRYAEDYMFALARPGDNGTPYAVDLWATTQEAWDHLHRECGDPSLVDAELRGLLEEALMGDQAAYERLNSLCSLPPHQLIPDRSRRVD